MRRIAITLVAMALTMPAHAQVAVVRKAPDPQAQVDPQAPAALDRYTRARDNLLALREGRRAVRDLTAEELQDVIDFERQLRGDYLDTRTVRQRCVDDEVRREGGNPSRLAWEVIQLKCRD
ncbi:hypothetical protein [Erythrobacter colymbi]|uniref:hypothetical protein n=1 Tax=Erythrobacter colymbi TaxID=1161202 RepID=UPI000A3C748B|nr:hypothetical protein [Erythrobacter colymbi]